MKYKKVLSMISSYSTFWKSQRFYLKPKPHSTRDRVLLPSGEKSRTFIQMLLLGRDTNNVSRAVCLCQEVTSDGHLPEHFQIQTIHVDKSLLDG